MSNTQNSEYLEDCFQRYEDGDANVREAIFAEMKEKGFGKEAEEMELVQAEKDGMNYANDDILNRIDEARGK